MAAIGTTLATLLAIPMTILGSRNITHAKAFAREALLMATRSKPGRPTALNRRCEFDRNRSEIGRRHPITLTISAEERRRVHCRKNGGGAALG
jgi:hypothetical protein